MELHDDTIDECLLEEQHNTDSKSKNQPRKLYKTLPDRSGARYLIDETRGKSRYIDINSKCPCFRVNWQEADSSVDAAKCDKILLQIFRITPSGNEIQLTTITIFVTNGRIQV